MCIWALCFLGIADVNGLFPLGLLMSLLHFCCHSHIYTTTHFLLHIHNLGLSLHALIAVGPALVMDWMLHFIGMWCGQFKCTLFIGWCLFAPVMFFWGASLTILGFWPDLTRSALFHFFFAVCVISQYKNNRNSIGLQWLAAIVALFHFLNAFVCITSTVLSKSLLL